MLWAQFMCMHHHTTEKEGSEQRGLAVFYPNQIIPVPL
jgi:hypothetical protein